MEVERDKMEKQLITILGPTASGKTAFAASLAKEMGGEIISADSRQVYRGMDIGTGKDLSEYQVDGELIPYHLIDIREPGDKYTLYEYQHDFHMVYKNIISRGKTAILCGGTGLYIESVLKGYNLPDVPANPQLRKTLQDKAPDELTEILRSYGPLHNTTDTGNKKRTIRAITIEEYRSKQATGEQDFEPVESWILGINIDRGKRREKITKRLKDRLNEGMIQEVERILDSGTPPGDLIYYGLEYKFVTLYVTGEISYGEMFQKLEIAIHQFAKRQMTWFRGMEKRGLPIHWIDANLPMNQKLEQAYSFMGYSVYGKKM